MQIFNEMKYKLGRSAFGIDDVIRLLQSPISTPENEVERALLAQLDLYDKFNDIDKMKFAAAIHHER